MKAIANPVEVEYGIIREVIPNADSTAKLLVDWGGDDNTQEIATLEMMARMTPKPGDYFVKQLSDGYIYLNPKDVFERKHTPVDQPRTVLDARRMCPPGSEPLA